MTIDFEKMARGESIDGDDVNKFRHMVHGYHPDTEKDSHAQILAKVLFGLFIGEHNPLIQSIPDDANKLTAIKLYEQFYIKLNEGVNALLSDELIKFKQAVDAGTTNRTQKEYMQITRPAMLTACIHLMIGVVYNVANGSNGVMPLLNVCSIITQQTALGFAAGLEKEKDEKNQQLNKDITDFLSELEKAVLDAKEKGDTTDGNSGHTTSDGTSSSGENTSDGPQH